MSDGGLFKTKGSKRSNPEARTTLDALHSEKIQRMLDEKEKIEEYKKEIELLNKQCEQLTSDADIWQIERKIEGLKKKIRSLENDNDIIDYYLRTGDILYNYYDVQEKIQKGTMSAKSGNRVAKPGSILAILEEVSQEEAAQKQTPVQPPVPKATVPAESNKKQLDRHQLLNKYLEMEDPEMIQTNELETDDPWTHCEACGAEMSICMNDASISCKECGYQEFILIDSDKPSYKDPPREVSYYAYKKINHFNEWLAQFQAKESTEIPQEIYDAILLQLKKERITCMSTLKRSQLREILKNMKCSKYYEHIPHIINRLNGQTAPSMSREDEERLRHMFRQIQPSFKKHCPKGRRNFLSYGYVLYKFCELLELDDFLVCFSLLKNREKLLMQDKTWQLICQDMGWQFLRTV